MRFLDKLFGRVAEKREAAPAVEKREAAPAAGEPLVRCFDCGRADAAPRLASFPWWDERVGEFATMNRCRACLPSARKRLRKQLARDETQLERFLDFVRGSAEAAGETPPASARGAEALAYATRVLERYEPWA